MIEDRRTAVPQGRAICSGSGGPPRAVPPCPTTAGTLFLLVSFLVFLAILVPAPGVSAPPAGHPGMELSPAEADLWIAHDLSAGARHLDAQRAAREAGEITDLRVVAVLVDFPDLAADRTAHSPAFYENLLFSRGVRPGGSVADYFDLASGGRLQLSGEVRGWYTVSQPRSFYTNGFGGLGWYPRNSQYLAEEAILLADASINYADLDNEGPDAIPDSGDDDQQVDGVLVIHAGIGREGGSSPSDFISVQWFTQAGVPVDGVFGRQFTLTPEAGEIGLIAHELGHLLGLPDLYDTDGGSFGLGMWSLMSGGWTLDGGKTPADLDAYSKAELGFAPVRRVFQNTDDLVIRPTADGGEILRLWRDGLGDKEYFLVENRQPRGIDAALPAGGLLIYHVDETIQRNTNPDRYRVALEQADGLYQLENRFDSASFGDDGDPFGAGDEFGHYSEPNSRSYRGEPTSVQVFGIRGPDADGAMTLNARVQPNALVDLVDLTLVELEGNGDGLVAAGEVAGVIPSFLVSGRTALDLRVNMWSLDPRAEILTPDANLGNIPAGGTVTVAEPLRVRLDPTLPSDPYPLPVALRMDWVDDMGRTIDVELGIGTVVGAVVDFEDPGHAWTHYPVRVGARDQWIYGPDLGRDATAGFKCGYSTQGFINGLDASLESPPVLLPPGAELLFDQSVDVVTADTTRSRAGGAVEISLNGGDWQPAVPEGGYPTFLTSDMPDWQGRGVFSGRLLDGAFHTVRVDLSGYSGSLRVRFRFRSEQSSSKGAGWHVDNVMVRSGPTPVRLLARSSRVEGDDVVLAWELAEPLPSEVRVLRGSDPAGARVLGGGWRDPLAVDGFRDTGGARELPAVYWLEGRERDGTIDRYGPWEVDGVRVVRPLLAVSNNPTRDATRLRWEGAPARGAALWIHDVRGRRVRIEPLPGERGDWAWDGLDDAGRRVAPGIYFARIPGSVVPPVRIVRLP